MTELDHPTKEILSGFAFSPNNEEFDEIRGHISNCEQCQADVSDAQRLIGSLRSASLVNVYAPNGTHLDSGTLIAYAEEGLVGEKLRAAKKHIGQCESCKTELLLYLAEIKREARCGGNGVVTPITENQKSPDKKGRLFAVAIAASVALFLSLPIWYLVTSQFVTDDVKLANDDTQKLDKRVVHTDTATQSFIESGQNIKTSDRSIINWYKGYIETTAIGAADMAKTKNKVHAEIVADQTARLIGYAQLAEIISGVQVYQHIALKDLLLSDSQLIAENSAFIKGARVVDKKVEWIEDVPKVSVTLRMPLFGTSGVERYIAKTLRNQLKNEGDGMKKFQPSTTGDKASEVSNVIIDAQHLKFTPALFLNIVTEKGELIYSAFNIGTVEDKHSKVSYFTSVEQALENNNDAITIRAVEGLDKYKAGAVAITELDAMSVAQQVRSNNSLQYSIVF